MNARRELGANGEDFAAQWLTDQGWRVIARNWRCARGELDIVAVEDGCLVGVEVKARRHLQFGHPVESLTPIKTARLRHLIVQWARDHSEFFADIRVDLIALVRSADGSFDVTHLKSVA